MSEEVGRRVFRELQALARAEYAGNTNALLVVYGVEGFLRRLAASSYAGNMTLKGGMLLAAIATRRMTRDADLSAQGVPNDEQRVARMVADIAQAPLDRDDGLVFDADTIATTVMREDAEYHGVRVKLLAHLATARMTTTLDFSFGDPQRTTVVELPELLGTGVIRMSSYVPEMTVAEKIATMISRAELNTRDRDFADVWVLSRTLELDAAELRDALREVAAFRGHELRPLARALADMPDRQQAYAAMLRRMAYQRVPPSTWTDLLDDVIAFADRLLQDHASVLTRWDPTDLRWY